MRTKRFSWATLKNSFKHTNPDFKKPVTPTISTILRKKVQVFGVTDRYGYSCPQFPIVTSITT